MKHDNNLMTFFNIKTQLFVILVEILFIFLNRVNFLEENQSNLYNTL